MCSRLSSVLSLLLLWFCSSPYIAAAQLRPLLPQESTLGREPLARSKASEQNKRIFLIDAERKPKLFALPQRFDVMVNTRPLEVAPESAHILIWQAPPNMDQDMILEVPKDFSSNMPIIKALPPFSGDIRGIFWNQSLLPTKPFSFPERRKPPK